MTALPATTDWTGASVTEGGFKLAQSNLRDYLAALLGADGTTLTALQTLGALLNGTLTKTTAYTVAGTDRGKLFLLSGTFTLSITSSATLGDGFSFAVQNTGAGVITIDPSGSEQIDAATTITLMAGESALIQCTGTEFRTIGRTRNATPSGVIEMYGAAVAPTGYLLCDGSAVSRTTYASLFAVIGTTWGVGDGSTTFNVPDYRGRAPIGAGTGAGLTARTLAATGGEETHTLTTAEMPSHDHVENFDGGPGVSTGGGAIAAIAPTVTSASGDGVTVKTSASGSGGAHNTMQPFVVVNFIIKT